MTELLLALDQGTTNTKAVLVGRDGRIVYRASAGVGVECPRAGFVEQDAEALWASAVRVMEEAAGFAAAGGAKVAGVAIANQRETAVAWDGESGRALAPAVSWQCRRGAEVCERIRAEAGRVRAVSGLPLDPLLSATKWAWLLEHDAAVARAAAEGRLRLGTVDAWLVWKLTGGTVFATDATNASRTALLDLRAGAWSAEMCGLFGVPQQALPEVRASAAEFGECVGVDALRGVPVVAAIGDSHGAMLAHGDYGAGAMKATYGTGSSLMALTAELVEDTPSLARTVAWSTTGVGSAGEAAMRPRFALEGNVAMTGSGVQWVGEFLGLARPTEDAVALSERVAGAEGVYFVPAMVGLGAPHWDTEARGLLCGLERKHTAAHMARAAVEAVAFQVADVVDAMEAAGVAVKDLRVDGGATRNRALMQFQADVLAVPVLRSETEELSALGAAYLGGMTLGWWRTRVDLAALPREVERFEPRMAASERDTLLAGWRTAVRRARMEAGR